MKAQLTTLLFLCLCSCKNTAEESVPIESYMEFEKEIAEDVVMLYSDSAKLKFRILSPRMEKYNRNGVIVEEFPFGLNIEFMDDEKNVQSSISSRYAKRISEQGTLLLKDSVAIINADGDKLETNSILWDELNHTLSTNKFIRLIKAKSHDTLYGFGFEARSDFKRFELQQFAGKRLYQKLSQSTK